MNERFVSPPNWGFEWPTWLVIATIYGGWFALVHYFTVLPGWISYPGLIVLTAWFMSLEHEVLHGHPTRWRSINRLFVLFPISPWFPYDIYKHDHLVHHHDPDLTIPQVDTESNYLTAEHYAQLGPLGRMFHKCLRTVVGRSLLGTLVAVTEVWMGGLTALLKGNFKYLHTWLTHFVLLGVLLWWLQREAGISPTNWVLGIAYPALMLAMLRSFYEHRPATLPAHRVVINEAAWPLRLLYLNNNYHCVHHDHPMLPWYRIAPAYWADRAGYLERNGQFLIPGYAYLLRHFGFRPVDTPLHPGFEH